MGGWAQVFAILGGIATMIWWLRADQKDFIKEIRGWKDDIQTEMHSFEIALMEIKGGKRIKKVTKEDPKKE